jgi:hypothetical protein
LHGKARAARPVRGGLASAPPGVSHGHFPSNDARRWVTNAQKPSSSKAYRNLADGPETTTATKRTAESGRTLTAGTASMAADCNPSSTANQAASQASTPGHSEGSTRSSRGSIARRRCRPRKAPSPDRSSNLQVAGNSGFQPAYAGDGHWPCRPATARHVTVSENHTLKKRLHEGRRDNHEPRHDCCVCLFGPCVTGSCGTERATRAAIDGACAAGGGDSLGSGDQMVGLAERLPTTHQHRRQSFRRGYRR